MFWRFGFHNTSSIDSLLDKDDVSLEAILDEDDLLQECKSQNTRLIDYFQRVDVLKRLLGYVTGEIEGEEERGRFKYPYVATEVLCSEIWSIVETCVNSSSQLLIPFWETVLDKSPEEMKTEMVMASHFAKINAVFLTKKPAEMLAFIQSQPSVVERLLRHVETPSIVDLLVRIIQLDEVPGGAGVLEWLSSENLMGRLVELLSPAHTSDMHTVVSELIKGILSMATASPAPGLTDGLQNGVASNLFSRELARPESVSTLTDYILGDFSPLAEAESQKVLHGDDSTDHSIPELPNLESSVSSVVHSISVVIELIRKNNSDYFEPYLFHTLRNRLIHIQQQLAGAENGRAKLEESMKEMSDRMGVVHLGPLLEIMGERLATFEQYLRQPRSLQGSIPTTVGVITPLTFERFRICELYAELLHCSNMAILNRPTEFSDLYDKQGRLQGGLSSLEHLARVIAIGSGDERDQDAMDDNNDDVEPALELPVTNRSRGSSLLDSDEDMSDDEPGSSDDDALEEIMMDDPPKVQNSPPEDVPPQQPLIVVPSSPNAASLPPPAEIAAQGAAKRSSSTSSSGDSSTAKSPSLHSRRSSRRMVSTDTAPSLSIGETTKMRFLEANVLGTLLDLFFEFPWNNFLHNTVYDFVHQILTGRTDGGLNRELSISLFRDAHIMQRIIDGQKRNDAESSKAKGVRLGYMGHLTQVAEDVIGALEHYPPNLRLIIEQYAPQPAWQEYVTGRFNETKKRDTSLLGGGKPSVTSAPRASGRWTVDEEDSGPSLNAATTSGPGTTGEFRRSVSTRPTRATSADFGPAPMDEEDDHGAGPPQFARYLAQEMHSGEQFNSSSDASDEDEDEDGGWLAQSSFDLGRPPMSRRSNGNRQEISSSGFDDAFNPGPSGALREALADDPFGVKYDEVNNFAPLSRGSLTDSFQDDGFGPFSDAAGASPDHFNFSSSISSSFSSDDSFDFGDFQSSDDSIHDGELTPTAGSWTLASGSESEGDEFGNPAKGSNGMHPISLNDLNGRLEESDKNKDWS
ncbi:SIT4 phosphatase-associated protein-domain-containing protein [Suillus paluster]|uniref:SIT4 phosphatase-associated protein-domain-containing protein n=1 Tax=Suillus paluster TaxID=48578 RepID=UPI001B862642|nr:SIT4 phosphatase-associated protein-domain-containing protein [Suillus paluster]KAG1756903.1 SIT4 phosphatase-associated protein-domain-containing protein [Suillus paluster]